MKFLFLLIVLTGINVDATELQRVPYLSREQREAVMPDHNADVKCIQRAARETNCPPGQFCESAEYRAAYDRCYQEERGRSPANPNTPAETDSDDDSI